MDLIVKVFTQCLCLAAYVLLMLTASRLVLCLFDGGEQDSMLYQGSIDAGSYAYATRERFEAIDSFICAS